MAKRSIPRNAVCALIVAPLLAGVSAVARADEGIDRQWYHHAEFDATPGLRAEPHHAVMLHLEPTGARGKPVRNSVPYLVREPVSFDFCVPKDDPHIQALTLTREGSRAVVVHVPRGAPCKTRTIPAGLYRLHIDHDGTRVPAEGVKAFVHVPRRHVEDDALGAAAVPGRFFDRAPYCTDAGFTYGSVNNPMFTFKVGGHYVAAATGTNTPVTATATSAPNSVNAWSVCRIHHGTDPNRDDLIFFNGVNPSKIRAWQTAGSDLVTVVEASGPPSSLDFPWAFVPSTCDTSAVTGWDFILFGRHAAGVDPPGGCIVTSGTGLRAVWNAQPALFTPVPYRAYRQGAQVPAPQSGEALLLNAACGQAPAATYAAWGDLSNLNEEGIRGFSNVIVRPGPRTAVVAYPQINYTGTPRYITEETCLNTLPGSIALTPTTREFVASTNACTHCDLSGVDLSGLSLVGGDFTGSVFTGANLANTNFQSARLDYAKFRSYESEGGPTTLTGTNFLGALLNCTDFQDSDLRSAVFWSADIQPVIKRDFSCWVAVQYARLNRDTFPLADWRYLFMNGAVFVGVSGQTLSTVGQQPPLDLSNARMSGTTGLTHVGLGGVNLTGAYLNGTDLTGTMLTSATLSGANFTGANLTGADLGTVVASAAHPATFNNAHLTHAFLKNAQLSGSFFRGAVMSPANLAGADLSGAWLEDDGTAQYSPTILTGSYMLNTKLNGAHMTGAVLDLVSWYNKNPAAPTATGAGALLTGASLNLADLPGLDLTGAHLQGATLTNVQLIGANLTGAQLQPDVHGHTTNLSTANLRGANLTSANFTGANLSNAGVSPSPEPLVYIEVLKDPDHYQAAAQYEYLAVNRPATTLSGDTVTTGTTICPNFTTSPTGCGAITDPRWVAPSPPLEPTNCQPTAYDDEGNVVAATCSSSRHPS